MLKLVVVPCSLDGGIASGPGQCDLHWLLEELEPLDLFDGLDGGLGVVEDHKCLALGLQVLLGDNVDDISIFGEDGLERLSERLRLDALLQVADVDTACMVSQVTIKARACMCRSAMTHTWRWVYWQPFDCLFNFFARKSCCWCREARKREMFRESLQNGYGTAAS